MDRRDPTERRASHGLPNPRWNSSATLPPLAGYGPSVGPSVSQGLLDLRGIDSATRPFSYHGLAGYRRPTEHRASHGLPNLSWMSSATLPSSRPNPQDPYPYGDPVGKGASTFHETHPEEPEDYDSETSGASEESVIPHTYQPPASKVPNMLTRLAVGGAYKLPSLRSKPWVPSQPTFPTRITKRTKERRLEAPNARQQAWLDRQVSLQLARDSRQEPSCGQDDSPTWRPASPMRVPRSSSYAPRSPTLGRASPTLEPASPTWSPKSPKRAPQSPEWE